MKPLFADKNSAPDFPADSDYWHALIDTAAAADFVGTTPKTVEMWRMKGGGPPFVRVSRKCIRYRRFDLREWADAQICHSTSDPGGAKADFR